MVITYIYIYIQTYTDIYIHIHAHTHTHTHTYTYTYTCIHIHTHVYLVYIYIYIYINIDVSLNPGVFGVPKPGRWAPEIPRQIAEGWSVAGCWKHQVVTYKTTVKLTSICNCNYM